MKKSDIVTDIENKVDFDKVEQYTEKFTEALAGTDESTRIIASDLVHGVAFMSVVLDDLEELITEQGAIVKYDNGGGQSGTRISPAMKEYNALIKTYNSSLKTLLSTVKKTDTVNDGSKLKALMKSYDEIETA